MGLFRNSREMHSVITKLYEEPEVNLYNEGEDHSHSGKRIWEGCGNKKFIRINWELKI